MVRREIAPTSQALQVAFSRLFREPMLSESTSFGSRWGIYEMSSSRYVFSEVRMQHHRARASMKLGSWRSTRAVPQPYARSSALLHLRASEAYRRTPCGDRVDPRRPPAARRA